MRQTALLIGFEADPFTGSEPGIVCHWAVAYARLGISVTILTHHSQSSPALAQWAKERSIQIETVGDAETAPKPPASIRQLARVSRNYRRFLAHCQAWIEDRDSYSLVHHVSWGTIRGGTVNPSDSSLCWGPLGGGHLYSPTMDRLRSPARYLETIRDQTVMLTRRLPFKSAPDLVLCTNLETAEYALQRGAAHVDLMLADGASAERRHEPPVSAAERNQRSFVVASRLVAYKRVDLLILAAAVLKARSLEFELTIFGDGPAREALQHLARRLKVDDSVFFPGRVPLPTVQESVRLARMAILASARDSSAPFLLEALAEGTPTLTVLHQGAGLFFGEPLQASVEPRKDHELVLALAEQMHNALVESLTDEVIDANREIAFSHTWDAKAQRVLAELDLR